jgi:hypothetical protein
MAKLILFYNELHQEVIQEWDIIKNKYIDEGIYDINFIEYNCTIETDETKELIEKYKINKYPVAIFTRNDKKLSKIWGITLQLIDNVFKKYYKLPLIDYHPIMK